MRSSKERVLAKAYAPPTVHNGKRAKLCKMFVEGLAKKDTTEPTCERLQDYHSCKKLGGGKQV